MKKSRIALLVGVVGFLVASLVGLRVLASSDWDPTIFVGFGEEALATREYGEERLGDVSLRALQGHDGKFFFVQANDPLVLDPGTNAEVLDRPLYRSQRMFYPLVSGFVGLLPPGAIVWSMFIVNLVAMGIGCWAVARLAEEMGGSPWLGLAFALNLGFLSEMTIDGAGIISAALAFLAVLTVLKDRLAWGVLLLALAALSREAMLIAAFGVAFWLWRGSRRRDAILAAGVPLGGVLLWAVYLRVRIELESGLSQVQEIGVPFEGFIGAFDNWARDPIDLTVGLAMFALMMIFTFRTVRSPHLVGWAFLGFVPLGILFTSQVWNSWFDISRAVAPIFTAYVVLLFSEDATRRAGSSRLEGVGL